MHDDHNHDAEDGSAASNPWADRVNEAYYDGMGAAFGQKTRERINWMCSQAQGASALDVGCSQGIASILMAREGMAVTGVDIFGPAIKYALAERDKEIELVRQRLEFRCVDLSALQDGLFDTVVMGEVIEHQTNPIRFIKQGATHVAPGGRIVITVPFGLHPWPDHKSTIFPGDIATALADGFSLKLLEVVDGYIRVVADRSNEAGAIATYSALLRATEQGALEAQKKFYQASADGQSVAKARAELEKRLAEKQESLASLEKALAVTERDLALKSQALVAADTASSVAREQSTEHMRLVGEQALANDKRVERIEKLVQEVAAHRAISEHASRTIVGLEAAKIDAATRLGKLQDELASANRLFESSEQTNKQLGDELRQAQQRAVQLESEVSGLRAELARMDGLKKELDASRMKQSAVASRADSLEVTVKNLRAQCEHIRDELAISQYKRHGHFAHLQATKEYNQDLVAFARRLHEDNERYRHSVALAVGRAFLGLTSARGILRFPAALKSAWHIYRSREGGVAPCAEMTLPVFKPVTLPPMTRPQTQSAREPANSESPNDPLLLTAADQQRKALSVVGWRLDPNPGALPVMSVLDEFSRSCFAPQASLIEPRPDNWEGLLEASNPRFLFVESSWKGNYGSWQYRVSNYANPPGRELAEMAAGFRSRKIPTVFWNKEDPVHFTNFIESASKFDVVLTTAAEAVPRYEEKTSARIEVLQFAAEESLHNPIDSVRRNGKVCFAGSFYANRFHERRDDQLMLLDAASEFDFDIFDRNHQSNATTRSDFAFPERFDRFVRGRLPYEAIGRAYRDYRVFLNVNSVIDSPTMFSRRVFELLACGTPVVSTWSRGTEETFGNDLIWHVRNREEAEAAIRTLMTDDREWRRRSLAGIRAVLSAHTYRHRFGQICRMLGIEAQQSDPFAEVLVVADVATTAEALAVFESFDRQVMVPATRKRLLLVSPVRIELPSSASQAMVDLVIGSETRLPELVARTRQSKQRRMLAMMSPFAVYGRHYLQDLLHAARYSGASVVGKPADGLESSQYMRDAALDPRTLVINESRLSDAQMASILGNDDGVLLRERIHTYASDSANYAPADMLASQGQTAALLQDIEV